MITRIGAAPRVEGMSIPDFQQHWRTSHADAAGSIPGLRRYVQNHAILRHGSMLLPYPGFDACSELDFDSVDAMQEGFASETYQRDVTADEALFVDKARFSMVVTDREVLHPGPEDAGAKLLVFYRMHPGSSPSALIDTLRSTHREQVVEAGGLRYELCTPIQSAHESAGVPAAADCVAISWWDDPLDAVAFESGDGQWGLSGLAMGAARLLATPIRVV